jgi:hypothetical protein
MKKTAVDLEDLSAADLTVSDCTCLLDHEEHIFTVASLLLSHRLQVRLLKMLRFRYAIHSFIHHYNVSLFECNTNTPFSSCPVQHQGCDWQGKLWCRVQRNLSRRCSGCQNPARRVDTGQSARIQTGARGIVCLLTAAYVHNVKRCFDCFGFVLLFLSR